ncbi:metallophosphoesterase family protein [Pseudohoeflea coraliihabitans]|uniref:Metallophosphoesterase n=1 Tax=Pseudohoeflea coraliihabitans TaxID=2860393 RepID=A0ABS6WLZ0_9HYPH|nr:metallophosphoesterase [Pseudohoeflea sp. DP4N28-3]MBW3096135.1 metallophosphoesterase [Pseudohoeflea sp. DP4N28-3]
MFRLVHISDVHLGPLPRISLAELASKRITGYVNWRRNRRKHMFGTTLEELIEALAETELDHVAITGDLVNLATSTEIETVTKWLETNFLPERTTLVPGNHDAYVPGALKHAVKAWRPWLLSGAEAEHKKPLFPSLTVRDNVALIGISSANASLPFLATGDLSAKQARRAGRLLAEAGEKGQFRVVLIHHPPVEGAASWHKRLKGIRRFRRMIRKNGAELVLHGHTHLNSLYHITVPGGAEVPVVGIASASQSPGARKPAAAFNLFEISGSPGAWELRHRRYSLAENGVAVVENTTDPRTGSADPLLR